MQQSHSKRLFEYNNDYQTTATIIDIIEQEIKLAKNNQFDTVLCICIVTDQTIFHPQGGGQPADNGLIDDISIATVKEDKALQNDERLPTIYHFIEKNENTDKKFAIGEQVKLIIDTDFRHQCARSHSAGHLIADIVEHDSRFSSYKAQATQGHHFPGSEYIKVQIAHDIPDTQQFITEMNAAIHEYIQQDLSVSIESHNNVRHIKIGPSERMCGGTHVTSTKDINNCKIIKIRVSKKNENLVATIFYAC